MLTKEKKQEIIKEYAIKEGDTGSPEVQVAVLTERIKELTELVVLIDRFLQYVLCLTLRLGPDEFVHLHRAVRLFHPESVVVFSSSLSYASLLIRYFVIQKILLFRQNLLWAWI